MATRKKTNTRKGPEKAPTFAIAHATIITVCALIAAASAFGAAMWAQGFGLTGWLAIGAVIFAGALAFLIDMVPVAFAPVWARSGWKLMAPSLVLLAGFMMIGGAIQVNSVVTFEKAQKAGLLQEATDRYNTAVHKLDSILMPERDCLCPQTRAADIAQFEAKRKAPLLDKLTAQQDIKRLQASELPIKELGVMMMIYQIVSFLFRSIISAVTARIQKQLDAAHADEQKRKDRERKAREKAKTTPPVKGGLRGNRPKLYLAAANDQ